MTVIPQRELRNDISSVLRRAENGECFTITVNGRAVAELGPVRQDASERAGLDAILASTPVDEQWSADLRAMREAEHAAARSTDR
jgi:prevent-host-death family protein